MNLYTLFEGTKKNTLAEDFNGLMMGVQENNGIDGALADGNGVSATWGTDNDVSPIGSMEEEAVTEDNIDEVAMNPSAFAQAISQGAEKGVLVGFEFETLIPGRTVKAWKEGPQEVPAGYDPNSITWIEGKTTNDLIDGILRTAHGSDKFQKVFDDLFKYKSSVQVASGGYKSVWAHYRNWAETKVRDLIANDERGSPILEKLKKLLKDREFKNMTAYFMNGDAERRYGRDAEGNPVDVNARDFVIRVLKDYTDIDFSGRVAKSALTPEVITQIKDAMLHCYRVTTGPVDGRCSQVANAEDGRRDEFYSEYIPGWSYRQEQTPELLNKFKQHFAEFCTETMGTDNLKDLLKAKWAFKGRVNNNTDTLKEKLWYYVTPGAAEPASLAPRRRSSHSGEYMDGAEFLKANLKDVFGDNMEIFRGYHQATKKLDRWYIEPDGSLRPNQGDYAAEVVSPPLKADAAMTALRTWYQKAQQLNFYTNNSTGLHINVSIPDKLDVLKLATFIGDNYVLKQFGRENNSYARSVINNLKGNGSLPTVGSTTFKDAEKEMKEMVKRISGDHFATVNFNGKYVSFRHAGGDYLSKAADIANTVGRFVRAMIIASDPTAYRDEYVGKLVKMMKAPEVSNSDKLALTDIRSIAARGIPVRFVDVVTTRGSTPEQAVEAAKYWAKSNYGTGRITVKVVPDPSARERLLADSGFATATKENIASAAPENFLRLEMFPTKRSTLEQFADKFSAHGTERGSAFGMYNENRDKNAVGIGYMQTIKQTDPGFVDAVKALRGDTSKPLPLPGTKAAPKADAAKFTSQRTADQEPRGDSNAQDMWTLNNGSMVQHYDPSQVNSERAYELARNMYSQYSRPVTISRDGVEYGRWPRQEQRQYSLTNSEGGLVDIINGSEEDALDAAQQYANQRNIYVFVNDDAGRVGVGGARPQENEYNDDTNDDSFNLTDAQGTMLGQFWGGGDAIQAAQELANARNEAIFIMNSDGQQVGSASPGGEVDESRIFHSDQKVNVIYNPHRSNKKIIVAKAVNHIMAKRVIDTYVHKTEADPTRQKLSAEDFILQPIGNYTREDQYGGGFGGGGIAPVTDTTSPVGGSGMGSLGESKKKDQEADYGDEYQDMVKRVAQQEKRKQQRQQPQKQKTNEAISSPAGKELIRVARRTNPEAQSDTDAVFGYLSGVAKQTRDNYAQVNKILRQLDPLSSELDSTERELQGVETVNKQQQDLLRRLSQRVDQVKTQTLPSKVRAADVPVQQKKDQDSKEREVIRKELDKPVAKDELKQQVHPTPAPVAAPAKSNDHDSITQLQQQIKLIQKQLDKIPGSYGDDSSQKARLTIQKDALISQLRGLKNPANAPMKVTPGHTQELLHDPEELQTELPFDEDEIMESRLYAMKRAGYDII